MGIVNYIYDRKMKGEIKVKKNVSVMMICMMMWGAVGCNSVSASGNSEEVTISQTVTGDSTLVEVKGIFEELGYDINWESTSKTVYASKKKNVISITANSDIAVLNGENIKMNTDAEIKDGLIYASTASMEALTGESISAEGVLKEAEENKDDSWKENTFDADLSSVSGDTYTITEAGVYTLKGNYSGMIYIKSEGKVKLILDNVNIKNENGPAIFFESCEKGIIESSEGSVNELTDGSEYSVDAKGCIFSNDDLDIQGEGIINVNANYSHGIASDDDIMIEEGTININTLKGDAVHANDGVEINGGSVTIVSAEDGISGDKYVEINDGTINILTEGEVNESSNIDVPPNDFGGERPERPQGRAQEGSKENNENNENGGVGEKNENNQSNKENGMGQMPPSAPPLNNEGETGTPRRENTAPPTDQEGNFERYNYNNEESENTEDDSVSSKGIKSDNLITINGGETDVTSNDHGIKCDNLIVINGGKINVKSNVSKGIKAVGCLFVNDGSISIDSKDEGIESKATITINGGDINISSQEDGINAGGGSGAQMMGNITDADEHQIIIKGGKISVSATGDGLDSNGNLYIYGGETVINGPSSGGDSALDSSGDNIIYGGNVMAISAMGMVECPESDSQNILNINLDESQGADTSVVITDSKGNSLYDMVSEREFQNIIFSSEDIKAGEEYNIYINGEKAVSLTAESGVTEYGNNEFGRQRGMFDRGPGR